MPRDLPKITDDDKFTITASFRGKIVRFWHYDTEDERKRYMMYAREYVEGWGDCGAHDGPIKLDFHAEFERIRDDLSRLLDKLGGKYA